ncbi:MAG: DUF2177 family protein [Alphaproteobacteria bacterium]|nr:DUF2177 family protein [Alphaproteobacteria bacterium]
MRLYALAYGGTLAVMLVLDLLWIGVVARGLYQADLGHLLRPQPNLLAAAAFYLLYPLGLVIFSGLTDGNWSRALLFGALFGFFAYMTYDLTVVAVMRDVPWRIALIDLAWGTVVSGVASAAGAWTASRLA